MNIFQYLNDIKYVKKITNKITDYNYYENS